MTEDDEISPAPPLLAGAEGRPPPSRQSRGSSPPPHSDAHGSLQRQGTDESNLREGKAGKSGKSGHGAYKFHAVLFFFAFLLCGGSQRHPSIERD